MVRDLCDHWSDACGGNMKGERTMTIELLGAEKWLELNSKLQKKKNALRKSLAKKGVQKREGKNDFDKYTYFSEAQYKELFTGLFSEAGLELKFNELEYETFTGTDKQANGRMPRLMFTLTDIDTGFYEETIITGEGIDKGDKAGYKAYTGALKYYLADTFLVATGDDPEKESPDAAMNDKGKRSKKTATATEKQLAILRPLYTGERLEKLLAANNIKAIEDLPVTKASELITIIMKKGEKTNE